MATQRELKALITLAGKIDPSLQNALMKANKQTNAISQSAKKTSSGISKVGTIAKGVFAGILGATIVKKVGSAFIEVGKNGTQLASDLSEVQNVVDTTFGSNSKKIDSWSKTALKSFGLSELQAKQFNGTMGAMLKSTGLSGDSVTKMSEKLTGLSGDMASFYNISQEDAFEKIQAGIAGETKPLKELGINMDVANLQAYALSKGVKTSYDKMDQAAQTALRYSYIMDKTKDSQGDFAKTSGSFANQIRLLKTNFQQLSSKIMATALPTLSKISQKANNFMNNIDINKIVSKIENLGSKASKVAGNVFDILKNSKPQFEGLINKVSILGDKILTAFNSPKPIIEWLFKYGVPLVTGTITSLVREATDLYDFINNHWSAIEPVVWGIVGAVGAYELATLALNGAEKAGLIIETLTNAWGIATTALSLLREGNSLAAVAQLVLNGTMLANPAVWVALAIGALIAVGVLLYKNWDTVSSKLNTTWDNIKTAFANGVNWCIDKINWFIEKINKIPGINIPTIANIGVRTSQDNSKTSLAVQKSMDMFASGGIATKTSIFGEDGPEMAIPLKKTPRSLGLLNQTAEILGENNESKSSSVPIILNFNFNGPVSNKEDVVKGVEVSKDYIEEIIDDILNSGGRVSFGK